MSAFPLTRRAALAALGASCASRPGCKRRSALAPARPPHPRDQGRRFADPGQHGRSDRGLGGAGASRRARPVARALYGARRPQRGDAGGADRLSLSRTKQRRPWLLSANAGHHQRNAPAQRAARRCRECAAAGDLEPISRWRSIRRWSSGPCKAAWSRLRRRSRGGRRGSWVSRHSVMRGRFVLEAVALASADRFSRVVRSGRTAGRKGQNGRQRHDSPGRARRPWRIRAFA